MRGRAQAGSAPRRSAVMRVGRESGAHRWTSGFKQRRGQRRPCRRREAGCSEPACGRGRCKLMWHRSAAPSWTARSLITLGFRLEAAPISWPTQLQVAPGCHRRHAACPGARACLPGSLWETCRRCRQLRSGSSAGSCCLHAQAVTAWRGRAECGPSSLMRLPEEAS